ncbi:hypothetical protein GYB61_08985 [bacterium]|nr:hypothetical protein [bacterium]
MHLYLDPNNQYLAVPKTHKFIPAMGFRSCFDGQVVPLVVCNAFIKQYGGRFYLGD